MPGLRQREAATDVFPFHRSHNQEKLTIMPRHLALALSIFALAVASALPAMAQDFPPDVTRGKAVYERPCLACHGVAGWGDGPEARSLRVAPANFHRYSSFLKSDEELLRIIEHGVVFSPMHSWQGQLTEGEMQDVLAYIRLLSQQGR